MTGTRFLRTHQVVNRSSADVVLAKKVKTVFQVGKNRTLHASEEAFNADILRLDFPSWDETKGNAAPRLINICPLEYCVLFPPYYPLMQREVNIQ